MFQRHEYHRENDEGNSKYYVSESDRNRSGSSNDDRANYNYKPSYNQDRDGNFYSGQRDYSKDGGSVEFSRTSTHVRDSDSDRNRGSSGGAYVAGSVYSPYGSQSYNRSSDQDGNRYSSSYSSQNQNRDNSGLYSSSRNYDSRHPDDSSNRYSASYSSSDNRGNQYSSGGASAGGAAYSSSSYGRNYDSRNQDDNRSSGFSSQPVYYKQETKTYYNDDNQRPSSRQNYSSNYSSSCDQNRDNDSSSRNYGGQSGDSRAQIQYSSSRY